MERGGEENVKINNFTGFSEDEIKPQIDKYNEKIRELRRNEKHNELIKKINTKVNKDQNRAIKKKTKKSNIIKFNNKQKSEFKSEVKMSNESEKMEVQITKTKEDTVNTNIINNTEDKYTIEEKENYYSTKDKGLYSVIIIKENTNIFNIAKTLRQLNLGDYENIIQTMKKIRFIIIYKNLSSANKLLKSDYLKTEGYNVFLPKNFNHSYGIIRGIPTDTKMQEIMGNIESEVNITEAERLLSFNATNKTLQKTETIKLTFRANYKPDNIKIYGVNYRVSYYIPQPLFCKNCLNYGHLKKYCQSKETRCGNCANNHTITQDNKCTLKTSCYSCKENHRTNSKDCPKKKKEMEIQKIRTTMRKSYKKAKEIFESKYPEFQYNHLNFPIMKRLNIDRPGYNRREVEMSEIVKGSENNLERNNEKAKEIEEKMVAIKKIVEQVRNFFNVIKSRVPSREIPEEASNIMDALTVQLYNYDPEQEMPGAIYLSSS